MSPDVVRDVVAGALLLGGGILAFGAGVGLLRFPDLLARIHVATKPQVLGLIFVLLGLAVRLGGVPVVWALVLVAMFQLLTSPVAAHMVARAGYRTGKVRPGMLVLDELTRDLEAAEAALTGRGESVPAPAPADAGPDSPGGEVDAEEAAVEEAVARGAEVRAAQARTDEPEARTGTGEAGPDEPGPDEPGQDDGDEDPERGPGVSGGP